MPIGVPMTVPIAVWISVPTIALSNPGWPDGSAIEWVSTVTESPSNPSVTSVHRMEASSAKPITVATTHSARASTLTPARLRDSPAATRSSRLGAATRPVMALTRARPAATACARSPAR